MGLGGRGVVGERWSQRVLWLCAIGSAVSLYYVAVERQAQNRARAVAEGLKALDGAGEDSTKFKQDENGTMQCQLVDGKKNKLKIDGADYSYESGDFSLVYILD
ncbi:hypothetical protein E2562_032050 [Oryza meyeriana var. granulata]|uniref:Uncharacterized protein n=1 Tax=Oryza meyeriana var. granulata TaxID=110450 RepID=A0A6G1FEQ0_9ORYZ|nr:hypothetical protein E2562_032050 [Oryza meyeriana var. granulata]